MDDIRILQAMRAAAWARAKGELEAMLATFYSHSGGIDDTARPKQFLELDLEVRRFINTVEENGLEE